MDNRPIFFFALLCFGINLALASSSKPHNKNKTLSVLTFNVLYKSKNNGKSLDTIKQSNADIICLRELTPNFLRQFKSKLGTHYKSIRAFPRGGTWGAGIISKYPLFNVKHFPLRPHRIPGLQASLRWKGKKITVVCVHLFPPLGVHRKSDGVLTTLDKNQKLRANQAKYLIKRFRKTKPPILLIGDMNEGRYGSAMSIFHKQGFINACNAAKSSACGATFPASYTGVPAVFEIDYILGKGIKFLKAKVIRNGGSDHYPVYSEFTF